jgi:serpin B
MLADELAAMGMKSAFTSGAADFSGMNGRRDLFITHVIHKATIEVNEEGSEATAATVVAVGKSAAKDPKERQVYIFRADHPFLFVIRDTSHGEILFMGRVANPGK